jgi:hypothetical protein
MSNKQNEQALLDNLKANLDKEYKNSNEFFKLGKCIFLVNDIIISQPIQINYIFERFSNIENGQIDPSVTGGYTDLETCIQEAFANRYDKKLNECKIMLEQSNLMDYRDCLGELKANMISDINIEFF